MPTFAQIEQAEEYDRAFRLWKQQERPSINDVSAVAEFLRWVRATN